MYRSIVVLTGAGVSAESGIQTFRAANGLWNNHRVEDVCTPQAFERDPALVQKFYNQRRHDLLQDTIQPNAGHDALAKLEREFTGDFLLVTQNIDDLHERAGSKNLIHMHGELLKKRCGHCEVVTTIGDELSVADNCMDCGRTGTLRPHIVWFGEMPMEMDRIMAALEDCDLFISIGTSGNVYPAAGFVTIANQSGAETVELNLESSEQRSAFQSAIHGPATEVVPGFVKQILTAN